VVIKEPAQFDDRVLMVTVDTDADEISGWNYTSQSSVLVIHASGRHDNHCGRGFIADIFYISVGKSYHFPSFVP